jgi:iron complex outermembrane recepter protein
MASDSVNGAGTSTGCCAAIHARGGSQGGLGRAGRLKNRGHDNAMGDAMKNVRILAGSAIGGLAMMSVGHAAENPAQVATLDEIIVTAERREASVQDTPLAVAVVDPEEMSRRGVKDFTNIDKLVPDVSVTRIVGSVSINIRGIQSGATSPTTETPNAVHIDGAYIDRPAALDGLFYDVQRIEVLKGPQGTLYGRNTPAGAVNIITNDPVSEFTGSALVEGGDFGLLRVEGVLNVPAGERFAMRLAVREYNHDGYYKSGFDSADQQSARLKGLWTISDSSSLLVSADYQNVDQSATPGTNLLGYTANTIPAVPVPADAFDDTAIFGPVASKYSFKVENTGLMAQFDHAFSAMNLTVQGAWRDMEIDQQVASISTVPAGGSPPAQPVPTIPFPVLFDDPVDSHWATLEARLTSVSKSPLEWVVGVFAFDSSTTWAATQFQPAQNAPNGPFLFQLQGPFHEARSYAVFGQATWSPTEVLHLTAGLRYNNDHKEAASSQTFGGGPVVRYPATGNNEETWTKTTGTLRVAYDLSPQNMIYASYSTGYQAGGFGYGSTPEFQPEENDAYEIGSKNRFLDDRLQLNVEAYYYDDRNRVVNVFRVLNPGSPQQILDLSLINAGKFEYKGASLDLQWLAATNTRIGAAVAYSDGKYKEYVIPAPIITILDGQPQNGPQWTGRISLDQGFELPQGRLDLNVSGQYRGESLLINITPACVASPTDQTVCNSSLPNNGNVASRVPQKIYEDAYWLADLSLRYTGPSDNWDITGYVNNIFDGSYNANMAIASPSSSFLPQVGAFVGSKTLPRTYGAMVSVRF